MSDNKTRKRLASEEPELDPELGHANFGTAASQVDHHGIRSSSSSIDETTQNARGQSSSANNIHPSHDLLSDSNVSGEDLDASSSSEFESTDYDDDASDSSFEGGSTNTPTQHEDLTWQYTPWRREGRVVLIGEWKRGTHYSRDIVIGPDWPCTIVTYVIIFIFALFVIAYLADNIYELVAYSTVVALTLYSLSVVFLADPGLLRRYHHARKSNWTYCDHCSSFRMPGTVHCSTCQVCVAGYDHHCPVSNSHRAAVDELIFM